MAMRRGRWRVAGKWAAAAVAVVSLALNVLCVPFYSGSRLPWRMSWRLEHGRMTVSRRGAASTESFYIAINNEGLKFRPDWRFFGWSDWDLTVPLWITMAAGVAGAAWLWRSRRCTGAACPKCGYSRAGLDAGAPCPECGQGAQS